MCEALFVLPSQDAAQGLSMAAAAADAGAPCGDAHAGPHDRVAAADQPDALLHAARVTEPGRHAHWHGLCTEPHG